MNEKILTAPLEFPAYFSDESRSLLILLLQKNPKKRVGSSAEDAEDIKKHAFFKDIDWEKLEKKQIAPPFRPNLVYFFVTSF